MNEAPRFKVDENLPRDVVALLAQAGFDACHVFDQGMVGVADQVLAQVCSVERRTVVTLDLDFADIRRYPPADHPGFIVLRLRQQDTLSVLAVFRHALSHLETRSPNGQLWIVDERGVRIRAQSE